MRQRALFSELDAALTAGDRTPISIPFKHTKPAVTASTFRSVIVIERAPTASSSGTASVAGEPSASPPDRRSIRRRSATSRSSRSSRTRGGIRRTPPGQRGLSPRSRPAPAIPSARAGWAFLAPGVGIHGTPDAASIGYSASHGCIRMRIPDAEMALRARLRRHAGLYRRPCELGGMRRARRRDRRPRAARPRARGALRQAASGPSVWRWMLVNGDRARETFTAGSQSRARARRTGARRRSRSWPRATGKPLGSTRYMSLRPEHRGLEIGWTWLARAPGDAGANVEAKFLLLGHAFERARLHARRVQDGRAERARARGARGAAGALRRHLPQATCSCGTASAATRPGTAVTDEEWPAVRTNCSSGGSARSAERGVELAAELGRRRRDDPRAGHDVERRVGEGGSSGRSMASPRSRTSSCAAAMSTLRAGFSEQTASTRPAARWQSDSASEPMMRMR